MPLTELLIYAEKRRKVLVILNPYLVMKYFIYNLCFDK